MKKKLGRIVEITIAVMIVGWGLYLLYMTQIPPRINGWTLNCLVGISGSMSMAADGKNGGFKPFQFYYTKPMSDYRPGDNISFDNKYPISPGSEGMTLKKLYFVCDGWYYSYALNRACADEWYGCRAENIKGKVVAGPYPLLPVPESFWRWLSLNWTLNYDQIHARQKGLWSFNTIAAIFSPVARTRFYLANHFGPDQILLSPSHNRALLVMGKGAYKFVDCRTGQVTGDLKPTAEKTQGVMWADNSSTRIQVTNGYITMWPDGHWRRTLIIPESATVEYSLRMNAYKTYEANKREEKALMKMARNFVEVPQGQIIGLLYMGPPITISIGTKKLGVGAICSTVGGPEFHRFDHPIDGALIKPECGMAMMPPFLLYATTQ